MMRSAATESQKWVADVNKKMGWGEPLPLKGEQRNLEMRKITL